MSLVTRFTLLWSLLTAGLVALSGYLFYRGNREHLLQTWRETLEHEAQTVQVKVQSSVDDAARDVLYLAESSTVREYVRASVRGAEGELADWRRRNEADFRALLTGKSSYFQVRLLSANPTGDELIRLNSNAGQIEVVEPKDLQQKGDRDYFQESIRLPPGAVYLSDVNLNQEFGQISQPQTPTLRTATKVLRDDGSVFGIIIINVDVGPLLREVEARLTPGVLLYLANAAGDYVIHPDPGRRFGTDLGFHAKFGDPLPGSADAHPDELLQKQTTFALRPGDDALMQLRVAVSKETILGGMGKVRRDVIGGTVCAAILAAGLIALAVRPFARRIGRLTEAVARYDAGQDLPLAPAAERDELGLLAQKFHEMADKVRDDVAKLDAARRVAEEATRAKDDFLAVMSHEIRTPMNAVIGLLRVLERNRPGPHQAPVLGSLRTATRHLMSLLDEALDYSKIKAGRIEIERITFSLHETLSDAILTHRPIALQKGIDLEFTAESGLPDWVRGDPLRLSQVLNNLLGNAIKFTDAGHVRLEASLVAESGEVQFVISDTGIGIAEADIGRIFAPFEQGHGEIGRRFGGTGLGLNIARSLVELQGGRLEVKSRAGTGSQFTVTLPLERATPPERLEPDAARSPDLSGRRLLYVEDIASNREVLVATLEETRATVDLAETGAEAVTLMRGAAYDLVLLDLQLPDTNGFDLARRVLSDQPGLRIVAVTAQVSSDIRDQCFAAGIAGVVAKPFSAESLFHEIERCLPKSLPPTVAAAERPKLDRLRETFAGDEGRVRRMVVTLAREFEDHERDLATALEAGDRDALRRLRHRLHSALAQLELDALRTALDAVTIDPAADGCAESARRHLRHARELLEAEAVS